MPFLVTAGQYETLMNRGPLSFRSSRLTALITAIADFIKSPRRFRLFDIENCLNFWKQTDPKEFADRGAASEQQLHHEVTSRLAAWGKGEIEIIDPLSHPLYLPALWNDNGRIQTSTNCYAYACDDAYYHPYMGKPQPGQLMGRPVKEAEHATVRMHVMFDDQYRNSQRLQRLIPLIRLCNDPIPDHVVNMPGYYLIALVTAPGADYHWLRQDRDGMWSHKPGWTQATNRDSAGKLIFDPRNASITITDRSGTHDYIFTTFYYAPRGGVRTGDLGIYGRHQRLDIF